MKKGKWAIFALAAVLITGIATASALSENGNSSEEYIWTDQGTYEIGENVTINFKNQSDEELVYGTSKPVWTIQRLEDGRWKDVETHPPDRVWTQVIIDMDPGESREVIWDQTEYVVENIEDYEEVNAPAGEYRITWHGEITKFTIE